MEDWFSLVWYFLDNIVSNNMVPAFAKTKKNYNNDF